MKGRGRKIHYAWLILAAASVMQGVGIGIISNCAGIYYTPICEELGFAMGALTFYKTLMGIFSILSLLVIPKLVRKADIRLLSFALVLMVGGGNILMGMSTKLWHWYALGILQGLAQTSFAHFIPMAVISNWFDSRNGTAMGVSCSMSGAVGMVMSRVLSSLIETNGWRFSVTVNGIVCILLAAPFVLLILRFRPEDIGMKPYGYDEAKSGNGKKAEGTSETKYPTVVYLSASFIMMLAYAMFAKSMSGFGQYLTGFGREIGLAASVASMVLTCYMFGNMCFKLLFGAVNDRLGVLRTTYLELGILMTAFVLFLTHGKWPALIGGVLFGMSAMVSNVQFPLLLRKKWGQEQFPSVYAKVSIAADTAYYLAINLFGLLYDVSGGYDVSIILCLVFAAANMLFVMFAFRDRKGAAA